eukprot:1001599-Rhodomonas_salina.9
MIHARVPYPGFALSQHGIGVRVCPVHSSTGGEEGSEMRGWNSRKAPSFKVWSVRFREAITVMMVALSVMFSFPENTGQQQHQQNKNDKEQHGENEHEENQQETEEKDPTKLRHRAFQELELDEATATWHDAKAAYKRLARKWHPDKNIDDPERAKRRFQVINAAFEVAANCSTVLLHFHNPVPLVPPPHESSKASTLMA